MSAHHSPRPCSSSALVARPSAVDVHAQLDRILSDARFSGSPSLSRFLQFTIGAALQGEVDGLKESVLGMVVFDRGDDFDPRLDPIVRVQAGKLRAKLRDYYENEGRDDTLRIEYPKGGYCPRFLSKSSPSRWHSLSRGLRGRTAAAFLALRRQPAGFVLLLVLALSALVLRLGWPSRASQQPRIALLPPSSVELTRLTAHGGSSTFPTLSRDGSLLVYSSDQGSDNLNLWVETMGEGKPIRITQHPAADITPDLSPDGKWVVFRSRRDGGGLFVVSITGEHERRVAGLGWWPRFSPDGAWISFSGPSKKPWSSLFVLPLAGGEQREVPTGAVSAVGAPLWTPDGQRLIFLGATQSGPKDTWQFDWYLVPWQGGAPVNMRLNETLKTQGLPPVGVDTLPSDWLGASIVFTVRAGSSTNVWRVPIDLSAGRVSGDATRLTLGAASETMPRCSRDGRMVFVSEHLQTHIYSLPMAADGRAAGSVARVTDTDSQEPSNTFLQLSTNGAKLLFSSINMGTRNLVVKDLTSGEERTLLDSGRLPPEFQGGTAGSGGISASGCDGGREPLRLAGADTILLPTSTSESASAARRWRLCETADRSALVVSDSVAGTSARWLTYPSRSLSWALLSADQRWVSLVFPESGSFVVPFDGAGAPPRERWIPLAGPNSSMSSLYWSHDGNVLYFFSFRDDNNCLWAQRLDPVTKRPEGGPFAVHHFHDHHLFPWSNGMSVAAGRIAFALTEPRTSIWMARVGLP